MRDKDALRVPMITFVLRLLVASLVVMATSSRANPLTALTGKLKATTSDLPRHEKLPLFNPHRKTFTCVYQDQHVPPIDPQAEPWFQQALALDDPNIYPDKRDYPKIYQLYTQAAERNHWKAMLNLAALILSNHPGVPEHDPEMAIRWVEKAMIGDALEFYRGRLKLPNLDNVLPLPPAPLPKRDGNKKTLIDGAKAVTPPPTKSQQGAALEGRELTPPGYAAA